MKLIICSNHKYYDDFNKEKNKTINIKNSRPIRKNLFFEPGLKKEILKLKLKNAMILNY